MDPIVKTDAELAADKQAAENDSQAAATLAANKAAIAERARIANAPAPADRTATDTPTDAERAAAATQAATDQRGREAADVNRQAAAVADEAHRPAGLVAHPANDSLRSELAADGRARAESGSQAQTVFGSRSAPGPTLAQRLAEMRLSLTPDEQAELDRRLARDTRPAVEATSGETAPPVVFDIEDEAIVALDLSDDNDKELGPIVATGVGVATPADAGIVSATLEAKNGGVEMLLRGVNPGKTVVIYRHGDTDIAIPVEVLRRVPKGIVVRDMNRRRAT